MNKFDLFQQLLTNEEKLTPSDYFINLAILFGIILLMELTYRRCGTNISDRKKFSGNFLLLGLTTMLIILIVKSSIILSLGLVGALSIVRFRAAIKEPEELAFVFFVIAIGLGFGAGLRYITIFASCIVILLYWTRHFFSVDDNIRNLLITVSGSTGNNTEYKVFEIISKYNKSYYLKRLDQEESNYEVSYHIETFNAQNLSKCKQEILNLGKEIKISLKDFSV